MRIVVDFEGSEEQLNQVLGVMLLHGGAVSTESMPPEGDGTPRIKVVLFGSSEEVNLHKAITKAWHTPKLEELDEEQAKSWENRNIPKK